MQKNKKKAVEAFKKAWVIALELDHKYKMPMRRKQLRGFSQKLAI